MQPIELVSFCNYHLNLSHFICSLIQARYPGQDLMNKPDSPLFEMAVMLGKPQDKTSVCLFIQARPPEHRVAICQHTSFGVLPHNEILTFGAFIYLSQLAWPRPHER